jgi:hypothetical protein
MGGELRIDVLVGVILLHKSLFEMRVLAILFYRHEIATLTPTRKLFICFILINPELLGTPKILYVTDIHQVRKMKPAGGAI